MLNTSIYEFPLNERIRNFMRLENLFSQIAHFSARTSVWDSQASLLVLMEILGILERLDIKNEAIKELERHLNALRQLLDLPGIEQVRLLQTLEELETCLVNLQSIDGKLTKNLREDDLLNTIKQRAVIMSGINNFEIPGYYYWLNQSDNLRQEYLEECLEEYVPVAKAINLILDLLRQSSNFVDKNAVDGFFQTTLAANQSCQLLRIALPREANFFPETSGSRHRISIRFLNYENTKKRPCQVTEDISFLFSSCGI